ncbi:MAG: MarR family transcriptional regulator [Burkholderiaceae bacterium]|jgi:IclR family mhp operon transcriptional activator|nr:MAG: MarR family transcriptional regulator [Burkholderiaceae bacterium]
MSESSTPSSEAKVASPASEVRALDRGIRILEALSAGAHSLADLHRRTGLPKPSLQRLLNTLMAHALVRRSQSDGLYRSNIALPLIRSPHRPLGSGRLANAGIEPMSRVTEREGWPCDLHLFDGLFTRLVESTRYRCGFEIPAGLIDQRFSIFATAAGHACLAQLPDAKIDDIIQRSYRDFEWSLQAHGWSETALRAQIEQVRERGYATRDLPGMPESWKLFNAIAVSCGWEDEAPVGAVTILWPAGVMRSDAFARRYLEGLRDAARDIARAWVEQRVPSP